MSVSLFDQDFSPVLALGAGSLGCLAAQLGAEERQDSSGISWAAAHHNAVELIATGIEQKLHLKISEGPFAARSLAKSIDENASVLTKMARQRDAVILFGELGDARAMLLIKALDAALRQQKLPVFALALEPFALLAESNLDELDAAREQFAKSVSCLLVVSVGLDKITLGIAARRIRKMAAQRLVSVVECFARALQHPSDAGRRLSALRGAHRAIWAEGQGKNPALLAVEEALAALKDAPETRLTAAILLTSDEFSVREMHAVTVKLEQAAKAAVTVCAVTQPAFAGHAECLLLFGAARAPNVVSINAP
jgi:hypothetical protein